MCVYALTWLVAVVTVFLTPVSVCRDASKLDQLGIIFKKNVNEVKSWPQIDLIFLVDASSSVGEENFHSELRFVRKFLSDLTVSNEHTKIAIITFSSQDSVFIHVDGITTNIEIDKCTLLNEFLPNIKYTGGGTYTLGAFQRANKLIQASVRNNTRKALFLITDGFSNGGDPNPIANALKTAHNVTIFTIGIKTGRSEELQRLATNNETCFLLHDFKAFESLARRALHADLQDGEYIPVTSYKCGEKCHSDRAECTCGTGSGQYACRCRRGYHGDGEKCKPCPKGTWHSAKDEKCIKCPDPNQESDIKSLSQSDCKCKSGYKDDGAGGCEVVRCPELAAPVNGYFVGIPAKFGKCFNVLNNACGVRCQVGYSLKGNSIRLCQENGTWTGIQPQCEVRTCTKPPIPMHGKVIGCVNRDLDTKYDINKLPNNMPVDTECTFSCGQGHALTGSTLRTCLPVAQWDGLRTMCKPIRCNRLGKVAHGYWLPEECGRERQLYGARCTLLCKAGFTSNGDFLTCRSKTGRSPGKWTGNGTKCIDLEPPTIKCPAEYVMINTEFGSRFGFANLSEPEVHDNSGLEVSVWSEPIDEEEHSEFEIGKTIVTYHAVDSFGNEATCNITVEVFDDEPPVIENCENPAPFLTSNPTSVKIQWDEPLVYDNSHEPVKIEKSHEFGIFEAGTTEVTYTVTDMYNNTNTCTINITVVTEASCDQPPTEVTICSQTQEGVTCGVTCQDGYGFALSDKAVCLHDIPGVWDVPDCTPAQNPVEIWQVVNAETECGDNETLNTLGSIVNQDGGVMLISGCERIRRNIEQNYRKIEFQMKNINKLIEATNSVGINVSIGEPLISCKNGSIPAIRHPGQKPRCVLCPKGTFYSKKKCIPCPPDTFSTKPGTLICEPCPDGRSTMGRKRAKAKRACKAQCPAGTIKSQKGITCESRPRKKISCDRPNVCKNGGKCIPVIGNRHKCACAAGWTGARCRVKSRVCLCQNGGTCDGLKCICPPGFVGDNCELQDSDLMEETEPVTVPPRLNLCKRIEGLCENNGTCIDKGLTGFDCNCSGGYIGRRCSILPCDYNPCPLTTVCKNIPFSNATRESYTCDCPEGKQNPPECADPIDRCESSPCLNAGICTNIQPNDFSCQCSIMYFGKQCEFKKDPNYVLHFPRSGINDFVIVDGPISNLSQVSMCVWLQTNDKGNYGTVLSYATNYHDNAFTVTDYSGLVLYVNGFHVVTDVRLNDGRWHHLCVTWNMFDGAYSVYVDSNLESSGSGLSNGIFISGNGKIVLGQEQDSLGGRFSRAESFIGKLSYVDIWNKVLNKSEVIQTMQGCSSTQVGNIRTWADFRNGTRGYVHIEKSMFCGNCTLPPDIQNGEYNIIENGRIAVYTCDLGYILLFNGETVENNLLKRQCNAASQWEGSEEPICEPVSCPYPSYVANAQIIGSLHHIRYKNQLIYKCLPGYEPIQPQIRTCTEDGTWSGTKPVCKGNQCTAFPKPVNSNVTIISDFVYDEEFHDIEFFEVGTQIEIACVNGAQLQGSSSITCQDNSTWDHDIPTCQTSGCAALEMPAIPENGYTANEVSGVSFDVGTVITFKCRVGHRIYGGNNFTECLSSGQWSELNITCKPIACASPPTYENMNYKNGYNITTYYFGNMLKYECIEGYEFYGNNVVRCLANGKWTKVKGQCTRISCKKPNVGENESIIGNSYLFKDSLSILCPEGSENSEYTMKCTSTGKWLQIGDCQSTGSQSEILL